MKFKFLILILFKFSLCYIVKYNQNIRVNLLCTTKLPNYICFICPNSNCNTVNVLLIDENGNVDPNYYSFNLISDSDTKFSISEYKTNLIQIKDNIWVGTTSYTVSNYILIKITLNEETKVFTPSIVYKFYSRSTFINTILLSNQTTLLGHGKSGRNDVNIIQYNYTTNVYNSEAIFQSNLQTRNIINCVQFEINNELGCFYDNDTKAYFVFTNNIDNIIPINKLDNTEGLKYIKYDGDTILICSVFLIEDPIYKYACSFGYHEAGSFTINNDFTTLFEVDRGQNDTSPIVVHNIDFFFSDNDKKILLVAAGQWDGFYIGKFLLDNNFELLGNSYFIKLASNIKRKIIVRYILKHSEKLVTLSYLDYAAGTTTIVLFTFPVCSDLIQYGEVNTNLIFTPEVFNQEETFTEIGILTYDFEFTLTDSDGNSISFTRNTPYSISDISFSYFSSTYSKYSFTYYLQNTEDVGKSLTSNICKGELIFCQTNCSSCEVGSSLCLTCKDGYSFKDENNGICISISDIPTNYYEDKSVSPFVWKKCHDLCQTCNKGSNSKSNNCVTCIDSYSLTQDSNCILTKTMPVGYYLNTTINKFISCNNNPNYCTSDTKCDKNYPLLVVAIGQCVDKCDSIDCDYCTSNYIVNIGNYCVNPNNNNDGSYNLNFGDIDFNDVLEIIKEELYKFEGYISILDIGEYEIMVYDSSTSISDLETINSKNQLTNINLNECQTKLESLFPTPFTIIKIDEKDTTSIISKCTYEIYDNNGNKIDIDKYCSGIKISISSPIINIDLFDYETAQLLSSYGYDVFDPNDEFFNDICATYTNENGTDVTLKDRQKDYYQSINFCGQCIYDGINYEDKSVNCICDSFNQSDNTFIDNEFIDDFKTEFKNMFISETFYVVKCYKLVFNKKYFKKNYGCWILLILTVIHIAIFIYFCIDNLKVIKKALSKNIKPPPNEDNFEENDEKYNMTLNNNDNEEKNYPNPPLRNKKDNSFEEENNNEIDTSMKNNIRKVNTNISLNDYFNDKNLIHKKHHHTFSNNSFINLKKDNKKTKSQFHKIQINKIQNIEENVISTNTNLKSIPDSKKEEPIDCDYDVLCFEEAEKYDHRTSSTFYWDYLSDKQNIINIVIDNSILDMTHLKLDRFIIAMSLDFLFNAVFFTDDYISQKYKNNGTLSFFVGLPKTIFSNLIVFVICFILDYLSNNKIEQIIKNEKYSDEFKLIAHKIMKLYKIKLIIYFSLSTLIMLMSFYFVSAFCAVYQNIQRDWIISGLESCVISLLFPFLTGIIITILWKISLTYQKKNLYKVTKWLKTI